MDQMLGRTIGDYRIIGHLGSGGMGDVYKAEHVRLGRAAVVKLLRELSAGSSAAERFLNEARIQAELNHPNIAVLYEFNDTCGIPCIIMEYVDGPTLFEILERNGRLPIVEALACFARIVETIDYIHERGVIHRDIKPQNIKYNRQGQIKLLDFGISKATHSRNLTADGSFIGTEPYLSPEQLEGKPASVQSDIWSLGALLYEMITGRPAFEAASWGELYKKIIRVSYTPPSVFEPSIPESVTRIIDKCLRKQPGQRYLSAKTLLRDVQACTVDLSESRQRAAGADLWGRFIPAKRIPWRSILVGVGVLLAVVVVGAVALISFGNGVQSTTDTDNGTKKNTTTPQPSADIPKRTVRINVTGPPAQLYVASEDKWSGPFTTPYEGTFVLRSQVRFKLSRAKYQDCSGEFSVQDVSEANRYTYRMCETGKYCPDLVCK